MTLLCLLFALLCGATAFELYRLVYRAVGRWDERREERRDDLA